MKKILRKEYFGGIFVDTSVGKIEYLNEEEYEKKKREDLFSIDVRNFGYPLLDKALSSPLMTYLEITKKCNKRCLHCFQAGSENAKIPELSFEDIADYIRQFSSYGGYVVRLSGGEPTLHPDLFRILEVIEREKILVVVNTHGCFDAKMCDGLVKFVKDVRISIEGDEKTNDFFRGKGSYRRVLNTIERIRSHWPNVKLTINMTVMKANFGCVEDIFKLLSKYKCNASFGLLRPFGGRAKREEMLTPKGVLALAEAISQFRQKYDILPEKVATSFDLCREDKIFERALPYPLDNSICKIVYGFGVDAFGKIEVCGYLWDEKSGYVKENIRGQNILKMWHESTMANIVRGIKREGCLDCNLYKKRCNGGCPITAFICNGSLNGRDHYCVRGIK